MDVPQYGDATNSSLAGLRVNIVAPDNGAGLSIDAAVIREVLEPLGARVTWSTQSRPPVGIRLRKRLGRRVPDGYRFDVNLFLEVVAPYWFWLARHNLVVPNPEFFIYDYLLDHIDHVLCKTQHAVEAFGDTGKASLIGFTSMDRWAGAPAASGPLRALHVAGRSPLKGTAAVLAAWRRHPEWPPLTVVQRPFNGETLDTTPSVNVNFVTHRVSDAELIAMQRDHAICIGPSEVEGFGHSIVEAMSAGAVVITTDGPPMNEIVRPDRGVLVATSPAGAMARGTRFEVGVDAVEAAVCKALALSPRERTALGFAARRWFVENDMSFRQSFPRVLAEVTGLEPLLESAGTSV